MRQREVRLSRSHLRGLLIAVSLLLATVGCGDDETSKDPEVVLEVQAPVSDLGITVTSLEYEIACDVDWNTFDAEGAFVPALRRHGQMELVGPAASSGAEPPAFNLWRATEQPLDGLCLFKLIALDEQEQTVCVSAESFQATDGQTTLVDAVVTCEGFSGFNGAASLAVEVPGLVPGEDLQTVEYTIDCGGDGAAFFETPEGTYEATLNGNLEVIEDPDRDGLRVWHSFLDLPIGPCTMQLRARDQDGEVICLATDGFVIAPNQTTQVQIVLVCGI